MTYRILIFLMKEMKYPGLATIAGVYRILAWITIVFIWIFIIVGIIAAFVSGTYIDGGLLGFLGNLLGAVFGSIVVILNSGLVGLAIAVLELNIIPHWLKSD